MGAFSAPGEAMRDTNATSRSVRHVPEREIEPYHKFNPIFWFGNIDDPVPPPNYRPDDPARRWKWHCRNSLHNFTFYVIGIADQEFERVGRYPGHVFNPEDGWNWAVSRRGLWRLPFLSYRNGRFKFYVGWRNQGNFGVKLNFKSAAPTVAERRAGRVPVLPKTAPSGANSHP